MMGGRVQIISQVDQSLTITGDQVKIISRGAQIMRKNMRRVREELLKEQTLIDY
jgi:hypothetical protein